MNSLHLFHTIIISIFVISMIIMYSKLRKSKKIKPQCKRHRLYLKSQEILNIANADFIAFFKYNYSNKKFITSHFMYSINNRGEIQDDTFCGDLPMSISLFSIRLLKTDDKDLYEIYKDDYTLFSDENIRNIYKNTFKAYHQNIFIGKKENPYGYIILSYSQEYNMPETDKKEILKLIDEIKNTIV